jgi:hypothetical protein
VFSGTSCFRNTIIINHVVCYLPQGPAHTVHCTTTSKIPLPCNYFTPALRVKRGAIKRIILDDVFSRRNSGRLFGFRTLSQKWGIVRIRGEPDLTTNLVLGPRFAIAYEQGRGDRMHANAITRGLMYVVQPPNSRLSPRDRRSPSNELAPWIPVDRLRLETRLQRYDNTYAHYWTTRWIGCSVSKRSSAQKRSERS